MTNTAGEGLIDVRNVTFTYPRGTQPVLKGVSLQIHQGEYVVITGPTGCGKTTLALCLNGIIPHLVEGEMSGEVSVGGLNTRDHPIHEMTTQLGMVFQNPEDQLFSLKVEDEVAFGVENMGYSRPEIVERVDAAIQEVGLGSRREYSIFHLSGGQKQKVAIATNLAIAPSILVLDAPTADLDPVSSQEVVNTLVELRRRESTKTFIVIDSDLSDVLDLADRILVMEDGQIVLDETPQALLQNHFEKLVSLGVRMPDHVNLMHWLNQKLPEVTEFFLEEDKVRELLTSLLHKKSLTVPASNNNQRGSAGGEDQPIIQFQGVSFQYKNGPVILDHFDMQMQEGEWLAIIGENGTGKSTLLKLISGLIKPDGGDVITAGVNTNTKVLEDVIRNIGYLFQNPDNQIFMSSLEEEIAFGPKRRNLPPEEVQARVDEALKTVGLEKFRSIHPFTLSRGQRQRLAVATVLAVRPKLLLLDEPTTGQDQIALDSLMALTQSLISEHGATVVMVTHDMDLVARYATRVIVLDKGKVLLDGTPLEVFGKGRAVLEQVKLAPPSIIRITSGLEAAGCAPQPSMVQLAANAVISQDRVVD
jgi:energy-coupling factor transporter ATP-binding protein EcfA2